MYNTIYWLTRLDYIQAIFIVIAIMSGVATIILTVNKLSDLSYNDDEIDKWLKRSIAICFISLFTLVFIPSKSDAILIIAGGKAYDYYQKDSALQKIPLRTTEYLKLVLENQINELKNK